MENFYRKLFRKLSNNNEGAFIPFIILGDPTPKISLKIIDTLIYSGVDALELGVPFSDPIADGIIIQNSIKRAFKNEINIKKCFKMIKLIRYKHPIIPIGLLMYANLIFNYGIENFYKNCFINKINSVLIVDVPLQENLPFYNFATKYNISQIFICPHNADEDLLYNITTKSNAYIYLISHPGVTGIKKRKLISLINIIKRIKKHNSNIPILQGFGIYEPNQVFISIKSGSSGVISGSAIIDIIEKNLYNYFDILKLISQFVYKMKKATYNVFINIKKNKINNKLLK